MESNKVFFSWRKSCGGEVGGWLSCFFCITFLICLEWRDVLDNVNVGINHPYINWIFRISDFYQQ